MKLHRSLMVLTVLSLLLLVPSLASATHTDIVADTSDGRIRYENGVFLDVNIVGDLPAGYFGAGGAYNWDRTYMEFQTTNPLSSAVLNIYYYSNTFVGGLECNLIVETIPPFAPLDSSDWTTTNTTITFELINETATVDQWLELDVLDYINQTGITAIRLRTDNEGTNPAQSCRFLFRPSENTSFTPHLEVTLVGASLPNFNVTYSTSRQIYAQDSCGLFLPSTQPYDPKVACEPDGDSCVAIFYENEPFCSRGMRYALSRDGFQTTEFIGTIEPVTFGQSLYLDDYYLLGHELPYDIAFSNIDSIYYYVRGSKVYVMPTFDPQVIGVTPYRFIDSYTVADGRVIGADMVMDCCVETGYGGGFTCTEFQDIKPIKFYDGNATNMFGTFQAQPIKTGPTDWNGWFGTFTYDVTNTTTTGNGNLYDCVELFSTGSCSAGGNFGQDKYSAYAEFDGTTTWRYVIEGTFDFCTGTVDEVLAFDNFGSPEKYNNQMWFGSQLYYRNTSLFTLFASESTDLISFGTPEAKYYENEGIHETINQSDASSAGFSNLFIWGRDSDSVDGSNGIWVQEQTTYPVVVSSNENVFATLTCAAEGFTTTGSGRIFQIFTPCLTGNQITFVSSKTPGASVKTFNVGSCTAVSYNILYADSPYDFVLTVKDAVTNENVVGANIEVTGESGQTSNSNGQATFNIQPIVNSQLKDTNSTDGCTHTLSTDGDAQTLFIETTNSGYVDNTFSMIPASKSGDDLITWTFDNNELVTLFPEGVVLDVRAFTSDGEEIITTSYNVSVTGNNGITYSFINGKATVRSSIKQLPTTFLLYDNRTTYNVTVTVDYITGTESQTLEVTNNQQFPVYIYLPFTILDLPCSEAQDCVKTFCASNGLHQRLSGCINSVCEYATTDCQSQSLCDTDVGCFQLVSSVPCQNDNTCQFNSNITFCIDDVTMYAGFCGSDGFCRAKEKTCSTFCNETLNYCDEKADCLLDNPIDVGYEFPGGGSIVHADCNFDNAGESFCIKFGNIPEAQLTQEGLSINDVYFTHSDFLSRFVTTPERGYEVGDVVIKCTDTCEVQLDFCGSGQCSAETGQCLTGTSDKTLATMVSGGWGWVQGIVPLELRLMAWIFFTLIIMVVYKQATGKEGGNNDRTTMIVGAIVFFAGIGVGWIHWIFLLIIGVLISLIIWKRVT